MPCVHVFRSANHQLGLYLRRMFVPRSKNVVSNAEIHDVGGLKSTAKVSLYDHDYGPSYYARCHKVVAQCRALLYVRHGLELGCSSWSVFSTDGDRREHRFFVLETCGYRRKFALYSLKVSSSLTYSSKYKRAAFQILHSKKESRPKRARQRDPRPAGPW